MSTGTQDKLIGRLPEKDRRALLEEVVHQSKRPVAPVLVEYGQDRQLEGATLVVGYLVAVAFYPGGGCTDVLLVDPAAAGYRFHAIPAARVCRVTYVTITGSTSPADGVDTFGIRYHLGEVLAGPPRKDQP